MITPETYAESAYPAEWAIQDEIAEAFRDHLGSPVAFEMRTRESDGQFLVTVTLNSLPSTDLSTLARTLETRLSRGGRIVEIQFERGPLQEPKAPDYKEARHAFDKVWKRMDEAITPSNGADALKPPVRDFVYLDVERLASLYAQSRKGLTTLIAIQERGAQSGSKSQSEAASAFSFDVEKFRGEMSVLHDHMFHVVEQGTRPKYPPRHRRGSRVI